MLTIDMKAEKEQVWVEVFESAWHHATIQDDGHTIIIGRCEEVEEYYLGRVTLVRDPMRGPVEAELNRIFWQDIEEPAGGWTIQTT
jgi:hypothetical protein|tara:strand:- start:69 stop:326 length:258 start_codon:yes stop_codon:yes gene_type:complete